MPRIGGKRSVMRLDFVTIDLLLFVCSFVVSACNPKQLHLNRNAKLSLTIAITIGTITGVTVGR